MHFDSNDILQFKNLSIVEVLVIWTSERNFLWN